MGKAVAFIETSRSDSQNHSGKLGGQCLMGLALYKFQKRFRGGGMPTRTETALKLARNYGRGGRIDSQVDNYSLGIALIFLTEVEPEKNLLEIENLVKELEARQKDHGGWGYESLPTGDTSQTQYGVLGLWAARSAGLEPPPQMMDKVAGWLVRTQDPSGGWAYQGKDPGVVARVAQGKITRSMAAAGLGSVYVAADYFGMARKKKVRARIGQLPPALIPVVEDESNGGRLEGTSVNIADLKKTMNDGNAWFATNYSIQQGDWPYYYIYALERYHAFRELVEDRHEEEPRWYNDGVEYLAERQDETGRFAPGGCEAPVGAAFAVLFLLRSTRDTIEEVIDRDGILRGGRGLPTDLSEIRLRDNKIVAPAITGTVKDMIGMLEDEEGEKIENLLDNPDALSLSGLTDAGTEFRDRLLRVARTGSYKARVVAVRTLGQQGDLDNVPILIYALTDGDPRVQQEADAGLRLISRRFEGVGLPEKPTPGEVKAAVSKWKAWYKTIRPDAAFIEPATD
jgi:hypothetical protein